MTGRNSPLYFVFTLWPFSLFRVPSRFLWIFTLSLLGLCAETIQRIWYRKKHPIFSRAIVSVTLVITIIQLAHTWRDYHLLAPSSAWLTTPTIAAYIADGIRFTVIGAEAKHNETFLTHGWQDPLPYERIRQLAQPNSNGIWHIRSRDVYAGRSLRRLAVIDGMLSNHIAVNPPYATVSAMGAKLLAIQSVGIIVSPLQLDAPEYKTIESVGRGDNFSVSVYPQIVPRVSIVRKTIEAATVEDAIQILESEAYQVGITALVELSLTLDRSEQQADARIVSETNQTMTVLVQNPGPAALLVVTDTYYPGWVATVNGTPTRIIPVNIASRGVVIPPGNSEVLMKFASQSVRYGIMISLSAHAIIAILAVFVRARVFVHTRQKVRSRGLHHPRSREVLPPHRR
jgi:hypothetical protein